MKGRWTYSEHAKFIQAMKAKVKWKEIARTVGTRTPRQCRSHFQKMRVKFYNRLLQESNKKNCSFEADLKEIGSSDEVMKKLFRKEKGDERKTMNNFDAESTGFDDWLLNDHEIILAYNEDYYIKGL